MNQKLLLGRYLPGQSIIHQLDPRLKLFGSFYMIALLFFCSTWQSYLWMFFWLMIVVSASKIPWKFFLSGMKPLVGLILFTVSLQILFTGGEPVYFSWGIITISQFGLKHGVLVFFRFMFIILWSTLLTLTTDPLALSDAIESSLRPLEKVKFPAHEVALMLSIALRFVPTLLDEATTIMNAQRARGVSFNSGSLKKRLQAMIPLLVPLFINSFNRADELAIAMEARGYQGGAGRSKYRQLCWQKKDTVSMLLLITITVGVILLRKY